jgi:hypothetical protein
MEPEYWRGYYDGITAIGEAMAIVFLVLLVICLAGLFALSIYYGRTVGRSMWRDMWKDFRGKDDDQIPF